MKKSITKLTLIIILILSMLSMAACGGDGGTTDEPEESGLQAMHFKLAHEETPEGDMHYYSTLFKQYLEEETDGKYTVDIFTNGQLGDVIAQTEQVQQGTIEIGFNTNGTIASLVQEANILNLHYLFPTTPDEVQEFLHTSEGMRMLDEILYGKGMKVLDWTHLGSSCWTANKPLLTPADWKGLKFRVMSTPIVMQSFEAYGANATPVPYVEVYSALQLKMVEGQANPLTCIKDMKFYEVQDYIINPNAEFMSCAFYFNSGAWDNLPAEGQDIIMSVLSKVNKEFNEYTAKEQAGFVTFFEGEGLTYIELNDEEIATFRELAQPVHEKYANSSGDKAWEILNQIREDLKAYL